jgi:hypothetical protein
MYKYSGITLQYGDHILNLCHPTKLVAELMLYLYLQHLTEI